MGEVSGRLNKEGLEIDQCPVNPKQLAELLLRITDGTVSGKIAKDVFDSMWQGNGDSADAIIDAKISDKFRMTVKLKNGLTRYLQQISNRLPIIVLEKKKHSIFGRPDHENVKRQSQSCSSQCIA